MEHEIDVNGIKDPNHDITYMGKAVKMEDGTWRCLANVEGSLCLVEIIIKPSIKDPRASVFCCSFCGKSADECEVIIAGPMVNICDECVKTAQDIVDDKVEERKSKGETASHSMIEFSRRLDRKSSKETILPIAENEVVRKRRVEISEHEFEQLARPRGGLGIGEEVEFRGMKATVRSLDDGPGTAFRPVLEVEEKNQ